MNYPQVRSTSSKAFLHWLGALPPTGEPWVVMAQEKCAGWVVETVCLIQIGQPTTVELSLRAAWQLWRKEHREVAESLHFPREDEIWVFMWDLLSFKMLAINRSILNTKNYSQGCQLETSDFSLIISIIKWNDTLKGIVVTVENWFPQF